MVCLAWRGEGRCGSDFRSDRIDGAAPGVYLRLSTKTVGEGVASDPILKGTLDVLVLRALSEAPMHGFEVTEWLERQAGGALELDDSAVYQALYRMEKRGLVEGEWGVSGKNRRARYYELTREGRTHLKAETARVLRYADTVRGILEARPRRA
jgi:PadR family transcriptional regulator, regulatory protein PadR